jgi:N-methylhydantoinase A
MDRPEPGLALAIDVGGTFTDVTLADLASGRHWSLKTPTTASDPSVGFLAGTERALALADGRMDGLARVLHGTTTATNAILEGKGAATGLVTTRGFRYVLEIGRHDVPRRENLYRWVKSRRPVPPELVVEVDERIDRTGAVRLPLDEAACRAAARLYRQRSVDSIAICFLHAYANAEHEQRARAVMAEEHPAAYYSLSSEVLPVFREYERSMAAVLNAYVMPLVGRYIQRLADALESRGARAPLYIMKSNGGVMGARAAQAQPVYTALSGPAAGVVGAAYVGRLAGCPNVISIDVGGTSADVCLIRDGTAEVTLTGEVGSWPLAAPCIDIHTVGAGGGSLASVGASGALTVGPASAGADPGPVCYGKGGTQPTVTDANLVLGRIPPYLLGGEMALDAALAERAIRTRVAEPLGLEPLRAADGILAIVNNNMMGAIRVITVERGHDPREFALVAFGGAGPLHAGALARLLGIPTVIVPPTPGVLSTLGLLATDLRQDFARTRVLRGPDYPLTEIEAVLRDLDAAARAWLAAEAVPAEARSVSWQADLRYADQLFELTVDWPGTDVDPTAVAEVVRRFHALHEQLYTYAAPEAVVELVTLRAAAIGRLGRLELPRLAGGTDAAGARIATRAVYFADAGGFVDCPVYARERLGPGVRVEGPAVLEQPDSTTLLLPGQEGRVDDYGNLIVRA